MPLDQEIQQDYRDLVTSYFNVCQDGKTTPFENPIVQATMLLRKVAAFEEEYAEHKAELDKIFYEVEDKFLRGGIR